MRYTDESYNLLRDRFASVVFRRGATEVARDLPSSTKTIYRIINGDVSHPSLAIKAGMERIVEKAENENGSNT